MLLKEFLIFPDHYSNFYVGIKNSLGLGIDIPTTLRGL